MPLQRYSFQHCTVINSVHGSHGSVVFKFVEFTRTITGETHPFYDTCSDINVSIEMSFNQIRYKIPSISARQEADVFPSADIVSLEVE